MVVMAIPNKFQDVFSDILRKAKDMGSRTVIFRNLDTAEGGVTFLLDDKLFGRLYCYLDGSVCDLVSKYLSLDKSLLTASYGGYSFALNDESERGYDIERRDVAPDGYLIRFKMNDVPVKYHPKNIYLSELLIVYSGNDVVVKTIGYQNENLPFKTLKLSESDIEYVRDCLAGKYKP